MTDFNVAEFLVENKAPVPTDEFERNAQASAILVARIAEKLAELELADDATTLLDHVAKIVSHYAATHTVRNVFLIQKYESLYTSEMMKPLVQHALLNGPKGEPVLLFAMLVPAAFEALAQSIAGINHRDLKASAIFGPLAGLDYVSYQDRGLFDLSNLKLADDLAAGVLAQPGLEKLTAIVVEFCRDSTIEDYLALYSIHRPQFMLKLHELVESGTHQETSLVAHYVCSKLANRLALNYELVSASLAPVVDLYMTPSFKSMLSPSFVPTTESLQVLAELLDQHQSISLLKEPVFLSNLRFALRSIRCSLDVDPSNFATLCELLDQLSVPLSLSALINSCIFYICDGLKSLGHTIPAHFDSYFALSQPPTPKTDSFFHTETDYSASKILRLAGTPSIFVESALILWDCLALAADVSGRFMTYFADIDAECPFVFDTLLGNLSADSKKSTDGLYSVQETVNFRLLSLEVEQHIAAQLAGLVLHSSVKATYKPPIISNFVGQALIITDRIGDLCIRNLKEICFVYKDFGVFCLVKALTKLNESPELVPLSNHVLSMVTEDKQLSSFCEQSPLAKNELVDYMRSFKDDSNDLSLSDFWHAIEHISDAVPSPSESSSDVESFDRRLSMTWGTADTAPVTGGLFLDQSQIWSPFKAPASITFVENSSIWG